MIRNLIFYLTLLIISVILIFYAFIKKDSTLAIVAEVEPLKTAISFHKPVRVKALHVRPGERVKKGDLLIEIERPELMMDVQKITNQLQLLRTGSNKLGRELGLKKEIATIEHERILENINQKIDLLTERYMLDTALMRNISGIKSSQQESKMYRLKLEALKAEQVLESKRYAAEISRYATLYRLENEALGLRRERLEQELAVLKTEQENLVQTAPFNGTIGSISVQLNELVPPYQTMISVYDENPDIIKAYMNERIDMNVNVGEKVMVESTNRTYAIEGAIVEIGSRIVSYPKQMNPIDQQQMWGKEIFIEIPKKNNFLNGEKVFVVISSN